MSLMTFLLADGIGKIVTNIVNHLIIHMTMHFLTSFSKEIRELEGYKYTLVNVYVELLVFTRIAGTS